MKNVIETIEAKGYVATVAQIETMSAGIVELHRIGSTYLRCVIASMQATLGGPNTRGRRVAVNVEQHLQTLEAIHSEFFAGVVRGVTTQDVEDVDGLETAERLRRSLERNRRASFARTAVSTLRMFMRSGGDVRTLDVSTITKGALREAYAPSLNAEQVSARRVERARDTLLRQFEAELKRDPVAAVQRLSGVIEQLQDAIDRDEPQQPAETTTIRPTRRMDVGPQRTRVGVPLIHRPAGAGT